MQGRWQDAVPAACCCILLQDLRCLGWIAHRLPNEAAGQWTGIGVLTLASHTSMMERAFRDHPACLPPLSLLITCKRPSPNLLITTPSNSTECILSLCEPLPRRTLPQLYNEQRSWWINYFFLTVAFLYHRTLTVLFSRPCFCPRRRFPLEYQNWLLETSQWKKEQQSWSSSTVNVVNT